jgi:hypothetical protein
MAIKSGVYLPIHGEFGDVPRLLSLCEQAEEWGWEGFFIWDLLYSGVEPLIDPWVVLSACAARTKHIKVGVLVTPVARRRTMKLARELLSLDQLSGGRVIAGVGLGLAYEFRLLGEPSSAEARQQRFEEGTVLLDHLLHDRNVTVPPGSGQQRLSLGPQPANGRIPLWLGMFEDRVHGPARARTVPINGIIPMRRKFDIRHLLTADELRSIVQVVADAGVSVDDVATFGRRGNPECQPLEDYLDAGITWWLEVFHPDADSADDVRDHIRSGPPRW